MTTSLDPSGDLAEIRQLIERYAGAVDRGDAAAAAELFTDDGDLDMWLDPTSSEPTSRRHGRTEIAHALRLLEQFVATQHVIGNAVVDVAGDNATGRTQCTAHHIEVDGDGFMDRVLYINYVDSFVRVDARWQFARRELRVRWTSVLPVESA